MKGWMGIAAAAVWMAAASAVQAQVPPDVAAQIRTVGRAIAPIPMAKLYAPLQPKPPAGVKATRDISYGPDVRNQLDVFQPAKSAHPRRVLIFIPGGRGDRTQDGPDGKLFYDNVMYWALKHGMVGVNLGRRDIMGGRTGPAAAWDAGGEDVAMGLRWVKANIAKYGGDPNDIFIWGHSAGALSLSIYLARPDLQGPGGPGVKGAILAGGPYNLMPVLHSNPLPGQTPIADDIVLKRSVLEGLKALHTPLFLGVAELDPEFLVKAGETLRDELCKVGKCPPFLVAKDHGHISMVYAINTADTGFTGPVLKWMKAIR